MAVRADERRLRESSLMRLAKMDKSDWTRTIREVTETAAATLDVSRASVWLFNEGGSEATCEDLFNAPTWEHEHGVVLDAEQYARYLQALREKRSILATDALTHPDTAEFVEGYLLPLDIRSMLDVVVWHRGAVAGIFCLENIGAIREWRTDDQDFATSVAEVVALALEVRERVRTEEALRVSETRFRTMFEQFPLSMQILTPEGDTLQVNQAFEKLFGMTLPDLDGYNLLEDTQLRDNGMLPLMERGFREEATVVPPIYYQLPGSAEVDGRWIQGYVYPVKRGTGAIGEVIVVHQDVTERKRSEDAQRQNQEELEARVIQRTAELASANTALQAEIVERKRSDVELRQTASELTAIFRALPDQYYRLDAGGRILDYRGNFSTSGPARNEIVGGWMQELLPAEVQERFADGLRQVAEEGATVCIEYPLVVEGRNAYFEARLVRLAADCGEQVITVVREITDRVAAEEALHRSEEHFRTLTENASDIVTILDPQGRIQYQSRAAERVFGYRIQEMVDSSCFDYFHPEDIAPTVAILTEVVNTPGVTRSSQFRFRHRNGGYVVCEAVGRTLLPHSAEGGIVVNTRDITARKEAEKALRESEARSSAIIQHALDCVITINHEGKVLEFNPTAEATFGFTRAEAVGKDLNELILPPEYDEAHHNGIARYLRTGERGVLNRRVEVPALRKDGSRITVELAAIAIPLSEQPIFTAYIRDVTEARRSQEALRESEERLRFALEAGEMGTFEWDVNGVRVLWSPALEVIHGRAPGSFDDWFLEVRSAIHPDDLEAVNASMMSALEGHTTRYDIEYRVVWPDGSIRWVSARGQVIRDEAGEPLRVVGICLDISERKEAEVALRQAKETAEAANRAKSEFLSRMSHELRTPMNSILGFGQILARKPLPADQRRSVDYILKAGNHLLELINEVLDIARIEANRLQLSLEPVSVSGVMGEALTLIQPLASQRGCQIEAGTTREREPYVLADRQRLTQVLLNLLSNAVKYNRPEGAVTLSCRSITDGGKEQVRIEVRDTGPGIPLEKQDLLFVPFERLGADQSEIEGTGLGLALSKRLVEAMGGELTVESVVGEGSTFVVTLALAESPLARLGKNGQRPSPEEAPPAPEIAATLLYIEDNLANLSLIETILTERPEIGLRSALQGRMGLDLALEHRPDLILLDLHLPDIPGEEVLRRLKGDSRTEGIPVVVISADATPGTIDRLLKAGAKNYLPKPLDVDEFLKTVDQILEMA